MQIHLSAPLAPLSSSRYTLRKNSFMSNDIIEAHKHSSYHRKDLEKSEWCGCFYCLKIFPSSEIDEWTDKGNTAHCPHCWIDSVIGDVSGYPITKEFLESMHKHWF